MYNIINTNASQRNKRKRRRRRTLEGVEGRGFGGLLLDVVVHVRVDDHAGAVFVDGEVCQSAAWIHLIWGWMAP